MAAAPATVKELYRTTAPPPSLGRGALLHRLGHRREHGRRQDGGPRPGIADLRALRPRPPVGQPRQRAVDLPCFQHQSRRRAGSRPRDACQAIAGERAGWHRPRLGNFRRPRTAQDREVVGKADAPETAASNLGLQSRIAGATAFSRRISLFVCSDPLRSAIAEASRSWLGRRCDRRHSARLSCSHQSDAGRA